MGMRFNKSVKLGKGIKANFSKSGVSTSFGRKGLSMNVGRRGVSLNVGIPGTGISYRTTFGAPKPKSHPSSKKRAAGASKAARSAKSAAWSGTQPGGARAGTASAAASAGQLSAAQQAALAYAEQVGSDTFTISVHLDEFGNYTFRDADGNEITDPDFIAFIKDSPDFKARKEEMEREHRLEVAQMVEEARAQNEAFTSLQKLAPAVRTRVDFEHELAQLRPQLCEPRPFPEPEPTWQQVQAELEQEAEREVKTAVVWREKSLKEDYVTQRLQERYWQELADWQSRKTDFEAAEQRFADEENAIFQEEYERRRSELEAALAGEEDYIEAAAEAWFEQCELPVDISAQFEFRPGAGSFMVDLNLPEIEDLPQESLEQLQSGNLKLRQKTQKQLRAEYAQCVFGTAVYVAASLFDISPNIKTLVMSGYTQRRDSIGEAVDDYIFSIRFGREGFYGADFEGMDPEEFCMGFQNRCKMTSTKIFKVIVPYEE